MKYKHIVWDWNGTVIDDIALSVEIFNEMCATCDLGKLSIAEYQRKFKIPVIDFYLEHGFDFNKFDFGKISNYYVAEYNKRRFSCSLHDGVEDIMKWARQEGISQSILSAYEQNYLCECVQHYGLDKYMENVFGLDNILAGSKAGLAKSLAERIGANSGEILIIGDTAHDKAAGDAMGADCVFVAKGHNSHERLSKLGVPVFASHRDLLEYLTG